MYATLPKTNRLCAGGVAYGDIMVEWWLLVTILVDQDAQLSPYQSSENLQEDSA